MPDLLLELFSEEIPARMQGQAAADLKRLVTEALVARGLVYDGAAAFATPRRLALHVAGVPVRQPDTREEKRGPRVGAPEAAIQGFLKSAGLASIDKARIEPDPKGKGAFYVAALERPGRDTLDLLSDLLPEIVRTFPWPKAMRWGAASARPDSLRWVRPLHAIVATFGPESEEPDVVRFEVGAIASGDVTFGHRFLAPEPIRVRRFDDYSQALMRAKVVLDPARRRDMILHDARDLAFAQGLELVEDGALLDEVAGLVEWPVVLLGSFDPTFLDIPPEAIRATIRADQKCFVLRRPDGGLANKFLLVSNIEASDGGAAIAAGNARVVRARLSDARFFWETDLQVALKDRLPKLDSIVFHEKLGTQGERVRRIEALARELAPLVGADPEKAAHAARLAKADLVTEMVGEFPELQGLMGRAYALAQGEDADVAAAIEEHYRPQGPNDRAPTHPVAIAVALADKLDTLVGFWAVDEKPTGSKDPYALRRAALGVIRIVLENGVRLRLHPSMINAIGGVHSQMKRLAHQSQKRRIVDSTLSEADSSELLRTFISSDNRDYSNQLELAAGQVAANDLLSFFIDRLKIYLRDKGARHDLIDAAINASDSASRDDLLMIVRRVEALSRFLETDDGASLLAAYKRAANILRIEEKKDRAGAFDEEPDSKLCVEPSEKLFYGEVENTILNTNMHLRHAEERIGKPEFADQKPFEDAMESFATLRSSVDLFFEKVTVNDPDPELRTNRLRLLGKLRRAMHMIADFSKIEV